MEFQELLVVNTMEYFYFIIQCRSRQGVGGNQEMSAKRGDACRMADKPFPVMMQDGHGFLQGG